ncbi:MAG: hypothetical protein H5U36_06725, partial [Candidatus Caldatribacterium sp.]|nr:hypothetical protein [Candidatus Caldatribacterium sp.]
IEPPESVDLKCSMWCPFLSSSQPLLRFSQETCRKYVFRDCTFNTPEEWRVLKEKLTAKVLSVLNLSLEELLAYKPAILKEGEYECCNYRVERFVLSWDEGITIPFYRWTPSESRGGKRACLVMMCDNGKLSCLDEKLLGSVLENGADLFVLDVRGLGETLPIAPTHRIIATADGTLAEVESETEETLEFEVATNHMMIGTSLLGRQVADLLYFLRVLRILYEEQANSLPRTALFSSGVRTSLVSLFASAIDDEIQLVVLDNLLLNYVSLVGRGTLAPMGIYLFDVLRNFDLDCVAAMVAPHRLVINRPILFKDGEQYEVEVDVAKSAYTFTLDMYQSMGCNERFRIDCKPFPALVLEEIATFLVAWPEPCIGR